MWRLSHIYEHMYDAVPLLAGLQLDFLNGKVQQHHSSLGIFAPIFR